MSDSGYEKLGYFELAIVYLMLGLGSLSATPVMIRIGPQLCMVIGCVFDGLWILTSIIPAFKFIAKAQNLESDTIPIYYTDGFIYFITAVTSVLGGLGEAL